MADGSRHSMAFIEESTYGTTPATPTLSPLCHTGTTLALSKNTLESQKLRNDRQISDFRHGAYQVGGDISFELQYADFDAILEAVLCGTWTSDTPIVGTDQLKAGTTRRSFTIERYFSDIQTADKPYHRFTGCEFASMSLSVAPDAMITGSFTVVGQGQDLDTVAITGSSYDTETGNAPLDSFSGTLKENGSTIAVITEIQLNLENGIDPRFVVGSQETIRPAIGRSNCSGQITAYFENSTLLDKFINETESSIDFTLPDLDGNELKFILPRVKYNGGQPDVSGEGPITLSMPFQALRDETETTNIIIERNPV